MVSSGRHARTEATYDDILALPDHVVGEIVDEPELHLDRNVLVPDLAGWRRERMPLFPTTAFFTLSPDWACEVVSPSSQRLDRVKKLAVYLEQGVRWVWLVDPLARTLEVYESLGNRWTLAGSFDGDAVVRAVPFDAIEIEIGGWWVQGAEPTGPAQGAPGG